MNKVMITVMTDDNFARVSRDDGDDGLLGADVPRLLDECLRVIATKIPELVSTEGDQTT